MRTIKKHWGIGFWSAALIFVMASIWALQSSYFPTSPALASQEEDFSAPSKKEAPQPNPARQEVVEKRTETSQTFDNGDGTFTVYINSAPIHYKDKEGSFKPIKTNIQKSPIIPQAAQAAIASNLSMGAPETYAYSAEENSIRAYFKERADEGNMFRAEVGDNYVSWQPLSMSWVYPDGTKETIATVQGVTSTYQDNKVSYYDLFPDVDEEFEILSGKIKDNIILYSPLLASGANPDQLIIEGTLSLTPGLQLYVNGVKQQGDFTTSSPIELRSSSGELVMVLDAPTYSEFSSSNQRFGASYFVSISAVKISLSVTIPAYWISDPSRLYPVLIDPTIYISPPFKDTFVATACPSTGYGTDNHICVGYNAGIAVCPNNWGNGYGLIMFTFYGNPAPNNIPSCIPSSSISVAHLYLYVDASDSDPYNGQLPTMQPMRMAEFWDTNWTWNSFLPSGISYYNDGNENFWPANFNYSEYWDVLPSVRQWQSLGQGISNYGFLLFPTSYTTTEDDWVSFRSSNYGGTSACSGGNITCLMITYTPPCTPSSTCCDANGCYQAAGTDCTGTCAVCNGSGSCTQVPADDSACGTIDCDGLDTTCRNYNDLTSNRCEGLNNCKDANTSDCTSYSDPSISCNDGIWCNGSSDWCISGVCTGSTRDCSDGITCTVDSCNESTDSCNHVANSSLCPSDGNPCTNEVCTVGVGCTSSNNSNSCDNGAWCDGTDTCSGGTCSIHAGRNCADAIPCTTDSCNEGTDSCDHAPNNSACSNGLYCDGSEVCNVSLGCQAGTPVACSDGQWCNGTETCNESTDSCQAGTAPNCADSVSCTTDSCNEATDSCTHTTNNSACQDGLYCNGAEVCNATTGCQAGTAVNCSDSQYCNGTEICNESTDSCQGGTPMACNDSNICTTDSCNETFDRCDYIPTGVCCTNADCNDGNPCTDDICNNPGAGSSCSHPNNTAVCNDGLWCNGSDTCSGGSCSVHSGRICNDSNPCTIDSCNEIDHCVFTPSGVCCINADCNDDNPCTNDTCNNPGPSSSCSYVNNSNPCEDGLFCTVNDVCSGSICTSGSLRDCNDNESCTADSCSNAPAQCVNTPLAADNDSDGYYVDTAACGGTDCDDNDASINPGAVEQCGNGIDEDCSGSDKTCPSPDDGDNGCGACTIAPEYLTPEARAFNALVCLLPLLAFVVTRLARRQKHERL